MCVKDFFLNLCLYERKAVQGHESVSVHRTDWWLWIKPLSRAHSRMTALRAHAAVTAQNVSSTHPHAAESFFSGVNSFLAHAHARTPTHTLLKHLSGCVALSRTPSSHELIGKAIKDCAELARWRNVVFCYLASKLTKPVRSLLADVRWALFYLFFSWMVWTRGHSNALLPTIKQFYWECYPDWATPQTSQDTYYPWGWRIVGAPAPLCMPVALMVGSQPSSWEVVPPVTPIRVLVYCDMCF